MIKRGGGKTLRCEPLILHKGKSKQKVPTPLAHYFLWCARAWPHRLIKLSSLASFLISLHALSPSLGKKINSVKSKKKLPRLQMKGGSISCGQFLQRRVREEQISLKLRKVPIALFATAPRSLGLWHANWSKINGMRRSHRWIGVVCSLSAFLQCADSAGRLIIVNYRLCTRRTFNWAEILNEQFGQIGNILNRIFTPIFFWTLLWIFPL